MAKLKELGEDEKKRMFTKELPKMILLVILYSFQGLPLGFFLSSVPIIFKKYLTYSQIGEIMLCTMPFSFKVLWSPFVEFYHIEWIGKRKTWIIPTQLIMCAILFYLRSNIEGLLIDQEVETVSFLLTFLVFIITCQDIAVDSWALEMLHPCNASYGSSSQSIGQRIGFFASSSLFISLNSPEFCGRWIYGTDPAETEPVLSLQSYIMIWTTIQFITTIYIAFFVPEIDPELKKILDEAKVKKQAGQDNPALKRTDSWKKRSSGKKNRKAKRKRRIVRSPSNNKLLDYDYLPTLETQEDERDSDSEPEEEETEPDLKQTLSIFWDFAKNRNLQIWFIFNFTIKASTAINANVSEVYLTNDLGFPKEQLSMIKVVCTPLNILVAGLSGYLASDKPYKLQTWNLLVQMLLNCYAVLVLLYTFPPKDQITSFTTLHVSVVCMLTDLIDNFEFVTQFAILLKNTDKRISGIHVTLLAAMSNMCSFLHKLYIFKLIDIFGIYAPQVVIASISLLVWVTMRSTFIGLKDKPIKTWHVSDSVIAKKKLQ